MSGALPAPRQRGGTATVLIVFLAHMLQKAAEAWTASTSTSARSSWARCIMPVQSRERHLLALRQLHGHGCVVDVERLRVGTGGPPMARREHELEKGRGLLKGQGPSSSSSPRRFADIDPWRRVAGPPNYGFHVNIPRTCCVLPMGRGCVRDSKSIDFLGINAENKV